MGRYISIHVIQEGLCGGLNIVRLLHWSIHGLEIQVLWIIYMEQQHPEPGALVLFPRSFSFRR